MALKVNKYKLNVVEKAALVVVAANVVSRLHFLNNWVLLAGAAVFGVSYLRRALKRS